MKEYPLSIDVCTYDEISVSSRGHHDLALFTAAAKPYLEDYPNKEFKEAVHEWHRVVPDGDGGGLIVIAKPNSRGAYPVTTIDEK